MATAGTGHHHGAGMIPHDEGQGVRVRRHDRQRFAGPGDGDYLPIALRAEGVEVPDRLLAHLSPLGWEHIGLTGDYVWRQEERTR